MRWPRVLFIAIALLSLAHSAAAQGEPHVDVLEVEGPITPIALSYIRRGIEVAENNGAICLIVQLDTPGGLLTVTKDIVQEIKASRVPVVVYVAPRGAAAASAGTLIALAGHAAAMAPDTSIGALSPVGPQGEELPDTVGRKEREMLKASAKALVQRRGEAAVKWVAEAVDEARAATAQEALEMGLIDFLARDLDDLLTKLDGFQVEVGGERVTLRTAGAHIEHLPMTPLERFLHTIADPSIALILMTIGINALIFELASPGGYVLGVVGAICLGLALYALGVLSVNYTGLLFIALAFVLFFLETQSPTQGIFTAAGVASFIFGAILLFSSPFYAVPRGLIVATALATGAFLAFVVAKAAGAQRRRVATGREGLMGETGVVREALDPEGVVFLHGELWRAVAEDGPVAVGERVRVTGREGLCLRVRRVAQGKRR